MTAYYGCATSSLVLLYTMRLCQIAECTKKIKARGWCNVHYGRWRRTGDPNRVGGNRGILTRESLDEFHAIDEKTGCWVWNRGRYISRYGKYRGKVAHRVVWVLFHGSIPDGMFVCHHCDNPPCINPDHLFLGTQTDNIQDAIGKGRMPHCLLETRRRTKPCAVVDCNVPRTAKGFCGLHYARWRTHGDPLKIGKRGPKKTYG